MKSVSIRSRMFVVLSLTALLGPPLGARSPQSGQKQVTPTFKVRVEYVEVDATVHDKEGRFIGDLKKEDFEVREDGKPQEIANLALVDVPVEPRPTTTLLTGQPVEPDVYTNKAEAGRLYLIVIDDLHVHPARSAAARRIARMFVEQNIAPNDLAAVVVTSGSRRTAQDFTNNRRLLLQAVDKVVGRKVISPGLASLAGVPGPDEGAANAADPQRLFNARTTLDTLASLSSFAGTIRNHRKTIVLIGEGPDFNLAAPELTPNYAPNTPQIPIMDETGNHLGYAPKGADKSTALAKRDLRDRMRMFIDAANRGNVTLYAFDPAVYTQGGDDMVDIGSGRPGDFTDAGEIVKSGTIADDIMAAQDNLRTMSSETGGFAVTAGRSFANAFERIRNENSHYYILGYYPSNDKRDGKFRKIDVKVNRPGVTVLARRGYVAPSSDKAQPAVVVTKEGTSAPLREALLSALPTPGLPITVTAAAFRGSTPPNASVLVMLQTPPGAVKFVEKDGRIEGDLELSFVAVDDQGKTVGGEHLDLAMPLKPGTHAAVERAGLLVQSRVALPPGRYVLRVGARDGMSERLGAVHCDLEVPDFAKLPLSMSGLVISSEQTILANPRPDKSLTSMLPGSPAVVREFGQDDQIGVLAEIYDARTATRHAINIVTTLVGEDGREAYRHEDKRSTAELEGTQGGFGYLLKVPLAGLPPGSYLLRVEARSQLDTNNPVARETVIRVIGK